MYVLDRKMKPKYVGNTLERPQLFLKRTMVKETNTEKEVLNQDSEFRNRDHMNSSFAAAASKPISSKNHYLSMKRDTGVNSFINFLKNPALVISNQKVDPEGKIILKDFPVYEYSRIQIIVTNFTSTICDILPLPSKSILKKDLRLKSNLKRDSFYTIFRGTSIIRSTETYALKDFTSTEFKIVDSISKLFDALESILLSQNSDLESLREWKFLINWDKLSFDEKMKKYDKFSSHELNLFIFMKDRYFFETIVKPFISNKITKNLFDNVLLGRYEEVNKYTDPAFFKELRNPIEIILLMIGLRDRDEAKSIYKVIESKTKTIKV